MDTKTTNIKYIVASGGRSGSIFVAEFISKSAKLKFAIPETLDTKPCVLHTHDATFQIEDRDDLVIVQPYRKDTFGEILSSIIAEKTNEWREYTGQQEPFEVDLLQVEDKYVWHKRWHEAFDHFTTYKNKVKICFEDFIGREQVLADKLGLPVVQLPTRKSPYGKETILNYDDVVAKYKELEQDIHFNKSPIENFVWRDTKYD